MTTLEAHQAGISAAPVDPPISMTLAAKMRLCTRCLTIAKPGTPSLAIKLGAAWLIGTVIAQVVSAGGTSTVEHSAALDLLLFAAIFHPPVCASCQSTKLVRLDAPVAKQLVPSLRLSP